MPNPLNNVLVPDDYTDATSILNVWGGRGGTFNVRDHPVFYELQFGSLGAPTFTEEAALQPGSGAIEPGATGVRFRNQVAGQAATVDARIAPPAQPLLTLTSAGTTSATVVTGIIPAAGTVPTAGSGFSYTHVNGSGTYAFTFTTAFAAAPVILATILQQGAGATLHVTVDSVTPSGFNAYTHNAAAAGDFPFDFIAQAVL